MRASTNIQPRRHLPSLVPEFKQILHQDCQDALPSHARVLNTPKRGYAASAKGLNEGNFSPEEFVAEAISLGHPADHSSLFPKEVKSKLDNIQKKTIHQLALERTEEIKRWLCFVLGQGELSKRT